MSKLFLEWGKLGFMFLTSRRELRIMFQKYSHVCNTFKIKKDKKHDF